MVKQVTEGISVSVESSYQASQIGNNGVEYIFAYRITIENLSTIPVQLLRRYWIIKDSDGSVREVEGEGVVGQQPIIAPAETYQYISSAILNTEIGIMCGTYTMQNYYNQNSVVINIPEFRLQAPFKLN